jgi:type IV secretion system protein VirB10
MDDNNTDGPNSLELTPKPEGIQRIRRTPFVVFIVCIVGIIVFQIFNISHKNEERFKNKKREQEQGAVRNIGRNPGEKWYEKDIYDNLRSFARKDEVPVNKETSKKALLETEMPGSQELLQSTSHNSEESKTKLELSKIEESQKVEMKKAYYDALKSPGQIARFKNRLTSGPENPDLQDNLNGMSSTGSSSNPLLAGLSSGLVSNDLNKQKDKINFLRSGVLPGDYLPNLKQEALSPMEVKAGTFIPAALLTGINSDLPGHVTAQVRQNVYDTVTGQHLLIPQGARLIGEYDSNVTYGQNRALVVWTRLLFPDGASINLEKMQGVDLAGYAGFKDKVNNHYFRIYANALLLSLVGAGYETLNPDTNSNGNSNNSVETVASNIGQQLAQTTSELTRKNIEIQPTITIRPGLKFNVFVLKDMILNEEKTYEH